MPATTAKRPVAVTVAGILLVVAGAFALLAAGLILLTGDGARVEGLGGGASGTTSAVAAVLAVIEIGSGALVLRRVPAGRVVGIAIAAIGAIGGLATITSASGLVSTAIFGFVIVALVTNREPFRAPHQG